MSRLGERDHIRLSSHEQQMKNMDIYELLHKNDSNQSPIAATKKDSVSSRKANPYHIEKQGLSVDLDGKSLLNGIILAEILGKPRFLRRGRGGRSGII